MFAVDIQCWYTVKPVKKRKKKKKRVKQYYESPSLVLLFMQFFHNHIPNPYSTSSNSQFLLPLVESPVFVISKKSQSNIKFKNDYQ